LLNVFIVLRSRARLHKTHSGIESRQKGNGVDVEKKIP